jgi:hypothetical protein
MLMSTASAFVAIFTVGCEKDKKDSAPAAETNTDEEDNAEAQPKEEAKAGLTTMDPGIEKPAKADDPEGDKPTNTDGKSDHPAGDHPAGDHPAGDHPK